MFKIILLLLIYVASTSGSNVNELRKKRRKATQYMSTLSHFAYPSGVHGFNKKHNIAFASSWVQNNLNKCTHLSDISSPSVRNLARLIEKDSIVRMLIKRTFDEAYDLGLITNDNYTIETVLLKLQDIMDYAPELAYNSSNEADPDNTVTTPLALLYGPLAMTESGEALSYLPQMNHWWHTYLTEWCQFLSSPASSYAADSWVNDPVGYEYMRMDDYIIPSDGYPSWNDWFIRALKPGKRIITAPDHNLFVTSCCDATTWHAEYETGVDDTFWIKEQPYDLKTLLNNDKELMNRYAGGVLFQSVLMPDDYHRWHAPVTGRIRRVEIVGHTYFTQINHMSKYDESQLKFWTGNIPYMAHLNTRSIIEIDTGDQGGYYRDGNIGKVLFIAVGLQDISSIINTVRVGDVVKKGSQLGYFQYGGSTVLYLFPKDTINSWIITPPISDDPVNDPFDPIIDGEIVTVGQHLFTATRKGRNHQGSEARSDGYNGRRNWDKKKGRDNHGWNNNRYHRRRWCDDRNDYCEWDNGWDNNGNWRN